MSLESPNITVEPVTEKFQYRILKELAEAVWPGTFKEILSPEQINYMLKMMYDLPVIEKEITDGISYFIVMDDSGPVGYISYGPYGKDSVKLHKCYLMAPYQGRGIGSKMLQVAITQAKESGASALRLNVNKKNERAIKAYLRNGFETVENVKVDIGNGFFMDDFVMEIKIK